ncbi:hypothetical protein MMC12_005317 [Toensbergia leucococca]|nr:hypothetical protein [Toensbergia leucococca]
MSSTFSGALGLLASSHVQAGTIEYHGIDGLTDGLERLAIWDITHGTQDGIPTVVNNVGDDIDGGRESIPTEALKDSRTKGSSITSQDSQIDEEKVGRLVDAITNGCTIHFEPSAEYGRYHVFATESVATEEDEDTRVEEQVALASKTFGRIINPRYRSKAIESLDIGRRGSSMSSLVLDEVEQEESDKENQHIEAERSSSASAISISGRRLAVIGQTRVEYHTIIPVQLDFQRHHDLKTPSIHSEGSELDCSSPLFVRSCQAILKQAYREAPSPAAEEPILSWLRDIETPPRARTRCDDAEVDLLEFWEDAAISGSSGEKSEPIYRPSKTLRNITDLRRPGYLEHNSFFQDTNIANLGHQSGSTSPASVQRDLARTSGYSNDMEAWGGVFLDRDIAGEGQLVDTFDARRGHVTSDAECSTQPDIKSNESSAASFSLRDPRRVVHFDAALAALEGHFASEDVSSPIQRFVSPTHRYSNKVHLEYDSPELWPTQPLKMLGGEILAKLEVVTETKQESGINKSEEFGPGQDDSRIEDHGWIERPSNPSPDHAMGFYGGRNNS